MRNRTVLLLPALVMIGTVVAVTQSAPAQQIFADWDAGSPGCSVGVWTDMCWGAEPMPNNGNMGFTYVAGISDGNANVTQNISITLDGLVIFGGVQLNTMIMPDGRKLTIVGGNSGPVPTGFIDINDELLMQSTGSITDLVVTAGPAGSTLIITSNVSPGELRMSNNIWNRIYGTTGTETIMFGTDLTVGGSGQIGVNLTTLINQGTIVADQSTELRIDPSTAGGMTNSGLMVARDGGLLVLNAAEYDNTLGEVRAEDASTVRFRPNAIVTGGLMVAQSGGLFDFNGGTLVGPTVLIDVGGVGQVTAASTVLNLTNDGVINHNDSRTLHTAGQLINTGSYNMTSIGNVTDLIFDSDTVLDGGGVINMSNNIWNRIHGVSGAETFTNVDNTIRGSGQIGINLTTLINQGTIVADQSTELRIDPGAAGGMTNSGLMVARDGGLLVLNAAEYDNALGEIRAEDASTVRFRSSAIITGGLMVAQSGGLFDFNGGTLVGPTVLIDVGGVGQVTAVSTVLNLTNDGVINHNDGRTLHTAGQLINTGSYNMTSIGNVTDLIFDSDTVLDGGGVINMSDNIWNRIHGVSDAETFTNIDNTIRGSGQIGINLTTLINQGTIVADQSTELRIDPGAGGMTNSGLMVARDGGLLVLNAAEYDNTLGEIRAENASTVRFRPSAIITSGLMVAQSGGLFDFNGGTLVGPTVLIDLGGVGQVTALSTVLNLTNDGVINHNDSTTLHTAGQLINTGSYNMTSIGNITDLIFDSDTVLDGGGVINMSNNIWNRLHGVSGAETFTNVDNTIRGSGQIGVNLAAIINQGTIVADQSTMLRIDPSAAGGMTNSGTLRAENSAELRLNPGPFTTAGSVFATAGSTITRVATDYIQTAGSTIIDGALTLNATGTVTLDGGILGGDGQINAHVDNVAGTASPGSSAGTLTVNGNYTQSFDASFAVEIGGVKPGQFDVLAINGNATLGGTLEVTFIAFDPQIGESFTVLTAADVFGEFDVIDSCAPFSVTYNTTSVMLTITGPCVLCPADFDDSGDVGVKDLLFLLGAWGPCPKKGDCLADFDLSGDVGVKDLLFLLGTWGPCP